MSYCPSCGRPIQWAITASTGRSIPLDPGLNPEGNLLPVETTQAGTLVVAVVEPGDPAARMTHFATCPKPKRRPRGR